jgi:hypothetical protein
MCAQEGAVRAATRLSNTFVKLIMQQAAALESAAFKFAGRLESGELIRQLNASHLSLRRDAS